MPIFVFFHCWKSFIVIGFDIYSKNQAISTMKKKEKIGIDRTHELIMTFRAWNLELSKLKFLGAALKFRGTINIH